MSALSFAEIVAKARADSEAVVAKLSAADGPGDTLMSESMLATLRAEYGKLKTIDPESPTYQKLIRFLDTTSQPRLKQLSESGIPFLSGLARNRVKN